MTDLLIPQQSIQQQYLQQGEQLQSQNYIINSINERHNKREDQTINHSKLTYGDNDNDNEEVSLKDSQLLESYCEQNLSKENILLNIQDIDTFRQVKNKQGAFTEESIDEIQSIIIKALSKKPKERRPSHLNELVKIMENLPFFQKYIQDIEQRDVLAKCCQQMDLEIHQKDSNVFEIGTIGEKFYLILEGEVEVYAKIPTSQVIQQYNGQTTTKNGIQSQIQQNYMNTNLKNSSQQTAGNQEMTDQQICSLQGLSISNEMTFQSRCRQVASKEIKQFDSAADIRISSNMEQYDHQYATLEEVHDDYNDNNDDATKPKESNHYHKSQVDATTSNKRNHNIHAFPSDIISNSNTKKNDSPMKDATKGICNSECVQLMMVKRLKEGDSFGELALIYNKPRLATIKCHTNCVFAVLQKKQYIDILKNAEQKNIIKAIDSIAQIPIFKQWSFESLKDIYLNSTIVTYKKGDAVFSKGDTSDAVYIVQQGEFSIRNKYENPCQNSENDGLFQKLDSSNKDGIDQLFKQPTSSRQKTFILLKMCTNEMFGEEDLLKEQDRSFDVFCSSFTGSLLLIKGIDFRHRVFERNDSIQEYILTRLQTKEILLQEKESNLKEQFYKYKNYLVENRQELKSIIFSQIMLDQSCSVSVHSPQYLHNLNSNTQGYKQGQNVSFQSQSNSPSKFKNQRTPESPRIQLQNSFMKLQNSIGSQNSSQMNVNFDSSSSVVISPRQTSKRDVSERFNSSRNEFTSNTLTNTNQRDSKQLKIYEYDYYANSPQKAPFKFGTNTISTQRSHSDSSRNYTKGSKLNSSFQFLDPIFDQNNHLIAQSPVSKNSIEGQLLESPHQSKRRSQKTGQEPSLELKCKIANRKNLTVNEHQMNENEDCSINKVNPTNDYKSSRNNKSNPRVEMQSPSSSTSQSTTTTVQAGFFQIEVSKRKRIMMASKYDYQNYLSEKDGEMKNERYLIPVKRILTKTLKEREPLLVDVTQNQQQIFEQQVNQESYQKRDSTENSGNSSKKDGIIPKNNKFRMKTLTKLNISTNSIEDSNTKVNGTPKTASLKSYYQYSPLHSPKDSQQYYDISQQIQEKQIHQRLSCKSADSKKRTEIELTAQEMQHIRMQQMNQKNESKRPKTQQMHNQLIPFQITPFNDEINQKNKQIISKKNVTAFNFLQQEQYLKLMECKSPNQNYSPKKMIESYKQYLLGKQQSIEKSKKLGAYTAFNKTKDTSFYIQKKEEKRMIQTVTDWKRSSQIAQNSEFMPYNNIQQMMNTQPIKNRSSINNNNINQAQSFVQALQQDRITLVPQEKIVQKIQRKNNNFSQI